MHLYYKGLKTAQNVWDVGKKTLIFLFTFPGVQGQVSCSLVGCHFQIWDLVSSFLITEEYFSA